MDLYMVVVKLCRPASKQKRMQIKRPKDAITVCIFCPKESICIELQMLTRFPAEASS
uniref:Uncharacterized protein n=1 Tax=Nelumbo nucifera TaxID=4432 RepID=A0A822YS78_NELNU|nr:TPA_asm: hypothetical protein HUJ06_006152 [Nelumbo nucifera]